MKQNESSKAVFAPRWEKTQNGASGRSDRSGILATGECLHCAEDNKVVTQIRKEDRMRSMKPEPQRGWLESGQMASTPP